MKKRVFALTMAALLAFGAAGCDGEKAPENTETGKEEAVVDTTAVLQAQPPAEGEEIAVIRTSEGVVKMMFYPEEAPKAVENFKTLAKDGYYDGLLFHRVIEDFMIQTGDPEGDGTGGESCWGEDFETEISEKLHFYRGAVAMANRGLDTNGSQFFIVQQKTVMEDALRSVEDARDQNEEELGITLTDGNYYTLSQLYPEAVMEYYREQGGSAHLEVVFGGAYTIFGQVIEGMEVVDAIAVTET
ncbi:MAG: peptidylprolyl isomerase, partial [Bacillota bacterium]|nr:peptidylprolyl isomerase [Bacillota bacterium]